MPITPMRQDPATANRYLADQLTEAERAEYEARMVEDVATLRELEATARFKLGLAKLRKSGRLDDLVEYRSSRQPWMFAAAAAIAMLAVGIFVLRPESTAPMLAATPSSLVGRDGKPPAIGSTYAVFSKRGGSDAVIQLPTTRQAIELRVLPEVATQTPWYRVALSRLEADGTVRQSFALANVAAAQDGFVSVFIDSAAVSPGDYTLLISSTAASAEASTFLIRFTPQQ